MTYLSSKEASTLELSLGIITWLVETNQIRRRKDGSLWLYHPDYNPRGRNPRWDLYVKENALEFLRAHPGESVGLFSGIAYKGSYTPVGGKGPLKAPREKRRSTVPSTVK